MTAVNSFGGVKYGFRMMLYFIIVIILGVILTVLGGGLVVNAQSVFGSTNLGQLIFGGIVALGGVLVMFAGIIGALYKMIADAVQRGNQATSNSK